MFVDHGCQEMNNPAEWWYARFDAEENQKYCERKTGSSRTRVSLVFWDDDLRELGHWTGDALGEATTCNLANYRPSSFIMAFVKNPKHGGWYTGASTAVPGRAGQYGARYDLESVAMHEFGHATAWVPHFDDSSGITQGGAACGLVKHRETMCSDGASRGVAWGRSLGEHDRHTFFKAYAPR